MIVVMLVVFSLAGSVSFYDQIKYDDMYKGKSQVSCTSGKVEIVKKGYGDYKYTCTPASSDY